MPISEASSPRPLLIASSRRALAAGLPGGDDLGHQRWAGRHAVHRPVDLPQHQRRLVVEVVPPPARAGVAEELAVVQPARHHRGAVGTAVVLGAWLVVEGVEFYAHWFSPPLVEGPVGVLLVDVVGHVGAVTPGGEVAHLEGLDDPAGG